MKTLNCCLEEYYDINVISKLTTQAVLELLGIVSHGSILKIPALNGYFISPVGASLLCDLHTKLGFLFWISMKSLLGAQMDTEDMLRL